MQLDPIETTVRLVQVPSVTDGSNAEVTEVLAKLLRELGFEVLVSDYTDAHGTVKQLLEAKRAAKASGDACGGNDAGTNGQAVAYFCHTDVVSVEGWDAPAGGPFDAVIHEERLWGRGACDMKGSIAAMLAAISRIDAAEQVAPIYFFMTGDEENGMVGADRIASDSTWFAEARDASALGIIGEPTELSTVNAHKGGCHIDVIAQGVAAHSSTSDGDNANWKLIPFLSDLREIVARSESQPEYQNRLFDPPTLSINIVVHNSPAMSNITVGEAVCEVFFRPMPDTQWKQIVDEILELAEKHGLAARPLRPLLPVFTPSDSACVQKFNEAVGQTTTHAVCFATDGCCLGGMENLIVFGPGSIEQAHRSDEWISLDQLHRGTDVFQKILERFVLG